MMIQISNERWREVKEKMCDDYCVWPTYCPTQERLDRHCEECPLNNFPNEDEHPIGKNGWQE